MAEVPRPSDDFLTSKKGPLPIWAWALIGLVIAYAYSRWRAKKNGTATSPTAATASTTTGTEANDVPDNITEIYNNIPAPVIVGSTPPVVTPPPVSAPKPPVGGGTPVTTKPPVVPPKKPPTPVTKPKAPVAVKVVKGDTLSAIAKKYGTTVDAIWNYNTKTGTGTANRPASTIKTLLARGKNLLEVGETIYIPPK